jgi:parallel beta-helix repeat protein
MESPIKQPVSLIVREQKIRSAENILEFIETDQIDPAGRSRIRANNNTVYFEKATAANWGSYDSALLMGSLGATCYVVASDAKTEVKNFAKLLQDLGYPVWVCVPPETPVLSNPEVKPIKEMQVGDKVVTHQGIQTVKHVFRRHYKGSLIQVETWGGEAFRLTPNHPVYAVRNKLEGLSHSAATHHRLRKLATSNGKTWIPAGELKVGDVVVFRFPSRTYLPEPIDVKKVVTVPFIEKPEGLFATDSAGHRNPRGNPIPRFIDVNEDFLFVAGLFVADGTASSHSIHFYLNAEKDANTEKRLVANLKKCFGLVASKTQQRNVTRIQINSVILASVFRELFYDQNGNKKLPHTWFQLPTNLQRILVEGMIAGDGCWRGNTLRYTTTSSSLAYALRLILLRLGISAPITRQDNIKGTFGKSIRRFTLSGNLKTARRRSYIQINDGLAYFPVRAISSVPYDGEVWNLEVTDDNSYTILGATLHNCDGTADNVEIQAAIDALTAGGKVILSEGTFYINDVITLKSSLVLEGTSAANDGTKLLLGANVTKNVLYATGKSAIRIANLLIDGNKTNNPSGGNDQLQNGIYLYGCTDCRIQNVNVQHCRYLGIFLDGGSTKNSLINCYVGDCFDGICVYNRNSLQSDRNLIAFNHSVDNQYQGITIDGCHYNVIVGNICRGNGEHGILLFQVLNAATHNSLIGNQCLNNTLNGICLVKGQFNTLIGNTCWGNGDSGIFLQTDGIAGSESNTLVSNQCNYNGKQGIILNGSSNNVFSGNHCSHNSTLAANTYSGVLLTNSGYNTIASHRIFGVGEQKYGIEESGTSDYNIIQGNKLEGNATGGALILGTNTKIRNNTGYATENSGTATFSGNGSTVAFSFAHGLATTPTHVKISAKSDDAAGDWKWSADATNVTITFMTAPASGTNNVVFSWEAQV